MAVLDVRGRYNRRQAALAFDLVATAVFIAVTAEGLVVLVDWSTEDAAFVLSLPLVPIILYNLWFR